MPIATLPGAEPFPPEIQARLEAAQAGAGRGGAAARWVNRLALETSPYLLQHAHNPVAWWPWGDEAFEEARRLDRPVFLSIGYATCHWCHVMERESFEDEEIAATLNARYVPIKVDREERPDVDAVYMAAVQALTGSGGWPMSVFLDAERVPFVAGTYFPARDGDRGASRGFLSILRELSRAWEEEAPRVRQASASLGAAVRAALEAQAPAGAAELPGPGPIHAAVKAYENAFDPEHGGLRQAPKFPSTLPVRLLLRYHRRARHEGALHMAVPSLERMANGGLMDQLAGGFHRYSTDARWLVPHFEKMLYDNALLAVAYVEAWQVTGRREQARVARQTLDYLLRDLALPGGAFAAATDADSEGEEGRYFLWAPAELEAVLGAEAAAFAAYHGVTPRGHLEGRSILHVPAPDEDRWESFAGARAKLLAARAARVPPLRDEKVVAAWNGLAISALATGGRALGEPRYVEAAARAARFLLDRMRPGGRLARTYAGGRCGPPGFLSDHACLTAALLDLHEATFDPVWIEEAVIVAEATESLFADPARGLVQRRRRRRAAHRPREAHPRRRRALRGLHRVAVRAAAGGLQRGGALAGRGGAGAALVRPGAGGVPHLPGRDAGGARRLHRRCPPGRAGLARGRRPGPDAARDPGSLPPAPGHHRRGRGPGAGAAGGGGQGGRGATQRGEPAHRLRLRGRRLPPAGHQRRQARRAAAPGEALWMSLGQRLQGGGGPVGDDRGHPQGGQAAHLGRLVHRPGMDRHLAAGPAGGARRGDQAGRRVHGAEAQQAGAHRRPLLPGPPALDQEARPDARRPGAEGGQQQRGERRDEAPLARSSARDDPRRGRSQGEVGPGSRLQLDVDDGPGEGLQHLLQERDSLAPPALAAPRPHVELPQRPPG